MTMTAYTGVEEETRIRQDDATGLWVLEIKSAVTGRWLVQSERKKKVEIEFDRKFLQHSN